MTDDHLIGVIITVMFHDEYPELIIIALLHHRKFDIDTFAQEQPANGKYKLNFTINFVSSRNLRTERIIAFELNWIFNPNENSDIRNGVENYIRNGVGNYVRNDVGNYLINDVENYVGKLRKTLRRKLR